jgi:hypothetical protein
VIADFKAATIRAVKAIRLWKFMRLTGIYCISFLLYPMLERMRMEKFENRIRLTLEVLEAVQSEWPINLPFVRISATDWADGG